MSCYLMSGNPHNREWSDAYVGNIKIAIGSKIGIDNIKAQQITCQPPNSWESLAPSAYPHPHTIIDVIISKSPTSDSFIPVKPT